MERIDLYNYPAKYLRNLSNMEQDPGLCQQNKNDIRDFSKIRLAKGSSHGRVSKIVYCLRFLGRWLKKPYRDATKNDLIALIGDLESMQGYSEYTRYDFKIVLKMFYKWLKGNDEIAPPEIKWLIPKIRNEGSKLPEDLLTEEEVLKIAGKADHPRDKALILVLYESGCRIGELLTLKLKNIQFDKYGAVLRVSGKTGDRRVRVISSASTLASWINIHPRADDPEAPVWFHRRINVRRKIEGEFLDHRSFLIALKKSSDKAGIKKRVYPHLFRHSRATSLATKLTEAQMKEHFGWVQGSDMASTYVHLSGRDVDNALLKLQGLVQDNDEKEDKMKVKVCQRCKEHNSPISKFCTKCGLPIDADFLSKIEGERQKSDNLMNKLMEDKEFREMMLKKISEMNLERNLI
jgi:integrase/recombinase XerD